MAFVARVLSKVLLFTGVIIFIFGDRALREFWKVDFVLAEVCGIGGGLVLMLVGAAIESAASQSGNADQEPANPPSDNSIPK
jgi:hypothetical protein